MAEKWKWWNEFMWGYCGDELKNYLFLKVTSFMFEKLFPFVLLISM
jgi:hypothetical protein